MRLPPRSSDRRNRRVRPLTLKTRASLESLEPRELLAVVVSAIDVVEGRPFQGRVATFLSNDVSGDPTKAAVSIDWGDGLPVTTGTIRPPSGDPPTLAIDASKTFRADGRFLVTVTVTGDSSSTASGQGTAVSALAKTTAAGTVVSAVTNEKFTDKTVATFFSDNPFKTADAFTAIIDFGDGISGTGTVRVDGRGGFNVLGSHTYTEKTPAGAPRVIKVSIADRAGTVVEATSRASVVDPPAPLSARLASQSDTGLSSEDGITSVNTPVFVGTSSQFALIFLQARRTSGGESLRLGRVIADSVGRWTLTSVAIPDGTYEISLTEAAPGASPRTSIVRGFDRPLVIDTTAPRLIRLVYAPNIPAGLAVLSDELSGLTRSDVTDMTRYKLSGPRRKAVSPMKVTEVVFDGRDYALRFTPENPRALRGASGSLSLIVTGLTDLAGNRLRGEHVGSASTPGFLARRRAVIGVLK